MDLNVTVVRVFTDPAGKHGNPLGVIFPDATLGRQREQAVAAHLNYSETIFVELGEDAVPEVRIYNPVESIPMAGHPLVGLAWLMAARGTPVGALRTPAGIVETWAEHGMAWIRSPARWAPPWAHVELDDAAAVEALTRAPEGHDFVQAWAWADERAGDVRARVFAPRVGIPEDEACGSASLLLAHRTGRSLSIRHGAGSVVRARPASDPSAAEVGGEAVIDGIRACALPEAGIA